MATKQSPEYVPFSLVKYDKEYYSNKAISNMSDSKLKNELGVAKKLKNKQYIRKLNSEIKRRGAKGKNKGK